MSAIVVDASVVMKWYLPEIHSDAALRLLKSNYEYFAPDLLFAELGSVIWKKVRRGELAEKDGERIAVDLVEVSVGSVPARALVRDAYPLAVATGQTLYDSLYLALAVRLNTSLVTADERLWKGIENSPALMNHVKLLQKFA